MEEVREFFDGLSSEYSGAIRRCVPRYHEMLDALIDYLPLSDGQPHQIVELGCGNGNLSVKIADRFPNAQITLIDISDAMLDICRQRLAGRRNTRFLQADFRRFHPAPAAADLMISSIALHHLNHNEQSQLFSKLYRGLSPGGLFAYADQFAGATPALIQRHEQNWKQQAFANGATADEWHAWMQHQRESDHHAPFGDHWSWLQLAGFEDIDCIWRHLLWTVVHARKTR